MLKIIGFIFTLFSGISLIVIASLLTGIKIDNISYKNINIKKLYLKYDKNLKISTSEITISIPNTTEPTKIRTAFTIDYNNDLFEIDVQEFHLFDTDVKFTGLVYIDKNQIDFNNKSDIMIEDANIIFDKQMKKVKAQRIFLSYEKEIINLSLVKPFYGDVSIEGSRVSFDVNKNILKLYLKTKSLFNKTLKSALAHYDVEINTIQYNGQNNISAKIFIPFDEGDIFIESDVEVLNSTIEDYGYKYTVNRSVLHYQGQIITGMIDLKHFSHEDINITNSLLNYKIDLTKNLQIDANASKLSLNKKQLHLELFNTLFQFKDNKIVFNTKVTDTKNTLSANIKNATNLTTKKLSGKVDFKYINKKKNIELQSESILYEGNFTKQLKLFVKSDKIEILKPEQNTIKKLSFDLKNDIANTTFDLSNKEISHSVQFVNTTDLEKKISYGNLDVNKFTYKNFIKVQKKNLPYNISFKENITANIPSFGMTYFKSLKDSKHQIFISNPNKLLNTFTFIKTDRNSNGYIDIISNDLNDTTILIDNMNFDINSSYFKTENNTTDNLVLPLFPKIDLIYTNSTIKYDNHKILFDNLNLKTNKNKLDLNITKNKTNISLQTKDNGIFFKAKNLTDTYINTLLNKDLLEGGYLNLNIYGEDINLVSGDINLHNTTIKNVTIVNSLLTFVNTTPAIFNPLLALPTLFRLAETGFDTNGYYMKNANGSFKYNLPKQQLDIYDLYTNGKMSNFIVNSHLDLETKNVRANVDISFLKDFTKAIRHIPVLGYIIMGDDGELHTSVDITGTIDDPVLETHTVKEATSGVTGVVERVLTLPLQPFQVETSKEEQKEHDKRVEEILK